MRTTVWGRITMSMGALVIGTAAATAHAQCEDEWSAMGTGTAGSQNVVRCMVAHDDGSGPALYIGGQFTSVNGVPATFIARWNGTTWSPVGTGVNNTVFAMAEFGGELYACGSFTQAGGAPASRVAKWNGSAWSPLGSGTNGSATTAMCVFDDGGGPDLYFGGNFTTANTVSCHKIARYDGTNFSPLAGGVGPPSPAAPIVYALAAYDDGSGMALYVGGAFPSVDGTIIAAPNFGKWDGTTWSSVVGGLNGQVNTLAVHNDGSGTALYVGGEFSVAGLDDARRTARWDGEAWSAVGFGFEAGSVTSLAVFDPGDGAKLFAAGDFQFADTNPVASIAVWNGTAWSAVGDGIDSGIVQTLASFGGQLHAGGNFTSTGGTAASRLIRLQCNPLGACCLPSGVCESRTQQHCAVAGAAYEGDASECAGVPSCVAAPIGACCLSTGCVVTWNAGEGGCIEQGGVYIGDATPCAGACDSFTFEVEGNSTKAASQTVVLGEGEAIVGVSTENGPDEPGADYFRIHTEAAPLAIYEHKLTLSTLGPVGHSARIVGTNFLSPVIGPGTWPCATEPFVDGSDSNGGQGHVVAASNRLNYWYGFGKEEGIYYHVWGSATTTGLYIATLDTTEVVPTDIGSFEPDAEDKLTITTTGQGHTADTHLMIFDENLVAIPGYGNDRAHTNGGAPANSTNTSFLRRTYEPGTYYMAIGINNLASTEGRACDDNRRFGQMQDLPNVVVATDASAGTNVSFAVIDAAGTTAVAATRPGTARAAWFRFTVEGAPCTADFDDNGTVEVPDIFAFLSAWFAMGPGADFDGNGSIAVPDIFAFLSAWFAGCP